MSHEPSSAATDAEVWRARRDRWTVVLATVIVMLQLVTLPVLVSKAQEADAQAGSDAPTAEPEPEPAIAPQDFSGDQRGQTQPFPIEGGLTVFDVQHGGGGNFIVVLNDAEGERVTGLVNVIGGFDGSTAAHVPAGDYRLEVIGSDWSVTVRQPRYQTASSLPVTRSGQGTAATEPFRVAPADGDGGDGQDGQEGDGDGGDGQDGQEGDGDGGQDGQGQDGDGDEPRLQRVTFTITHQGEGNVRMTLLDERGRRVEGVVNSRDTVDTISRVQLPAGIYLLDVNASGEWNVEIE